MENEIRTGDYVSGIEIVGGESTHKEIRGWVKFVNDDRTISLKADDEYDGNRRAYINADTAHRLNRVVDWQTANMRTIPVGTIVKHFKNRQYKVLGYANHVDGGKCVVYQAEYGDNTVYIREYSEFMSEVDHVKYPNVTQKYRFEEID